MLTGAAALLVVEVARSLKRWRLGGLMIEVGVRGVEAIAVVGGGGVLLTIVTATRPMHSPMTKPAIVRMERL